MSKSDVSAVTKYFPTINEGFQTTVASPGVTSGALIVPLASIAGLTDGTVFVGIVEPGLTNQQVFTGTVDTANSRITGVKWTRGSNVSHATGTTVVDWDTGTAIQMMSAGIQIALTQAGAPTAALLGAIYPVGSLYINAAVSTNPATLLGFGTWAAFGTGRTLVGIDTGQTEFATLGETGGQKTTNHTFLSPPLNTSAFQDPGQNYLTSAEGDMNAWLTAGASSTAVRNITIRNVGGAIGTNSTTGTEVGHYRYTAPNLQPYITVYIWKRTA